MKEYLERENSMKSGLPSDRSMRWLAAALIVAALLCVAFLSSAAANPIGRTEDLTSVEFNLGNYTFRIPRAYLWLKPHWYGQSLDGGPETKGVLLEVTIDDMRPYTKERREMFEGRGSALTVLKIGLNVGTYNRFRGEAFLQPEIWAKCEKVKELGYLRCNPKAAEPYFLDWQNVFILNAENEANFVTCEINRVKSMRKKYFGCYSEFRVRPYLFMKVTFEQSHLKDAARVILGARRLIESFYVDSGEASPGNRSKP